MKGSIRFSNVRKAFRWRGSRSPHETIKGAFFHRKTRRRRTSREQFVALDGIDLEVTTGEAVALIGPNGSGKSTLLKLIGGILKPTSGTVEVTGRVTALIEVGAGFHPEISGRENVVINGMLLGLGRREIEERMQEIVDFADIGPFIDQPVKIYSSGMYVRLGFAVAVAADPDILLIDEVLAVGDEAFTRRCLDRLARMRQRGVTMVLVSHDLDLVTSFADRALYLDRGGIVTEGPADAVAARYRSDAAGGSRRDDPPQPAREDDDKTRWGNGNVEIDTVELLVGGKRSRLVAGGSPCSLRIRYSVNEPMEDFVFGVAWHRSDGTQVSGHNTDLAGFEPLRLATDGEVCCEYDSLQLAPGEYLVDVAIHARNGLAYDYWCDALKVRVTSEVEWPGVWSPPHRWRSTGPEWRIGDEFRRATSIEHDE
ncbi:MAG: ABC transporter ATP-binding protein [Acidobacteria bacterium]|uniref:ABC transporter ATP-binding protein n=1 Tax=Candidatus Sulfomarinibacter kjeldsenii TaxID=2885994 RepID=A0A8J6Y016_9BACT|nr:ABC transporter ATP-binding protein [Candidatus Sulfomarinibacter kjeldsenii]